MSQSITVGGGNALKHCFTAAVSMKKKKKKKDAHSEQKKKRAQ